MELCRSSLSLSSPELVLTGDDTQDNTSRGVHQTLPGHAGNVTTLKFLPNKDGGKSDIMASGDSAGVVRLWREVQAVRPSFCRARDSPDEYRGRQEWSVYAVLQGHSQSISCLASIPVDDESILVVTGGSEGALHVWKVNASGSGSSFSVVTTPDPN
jgi:WD40 repeat protein